MNLRCLSRRRLRWGALLLMGVYLLAGTGIAQGLVTLVALLDGSHQVGLQTRDGETVLILSHGMKDVSCRDSRGHRAGSPHSRMVTAVLVLAQPAPESADHVFRLPPASQQLNRTTGRLVDPPWRAPSLAPTPGGICVQQRCLRLSPADPGAPLLALLATDSVILLI